MRKESRYRVWLTFTGTVQQTGKRLAMGRKSGPNTGFRETMLTRRTAYGV